MSTVNRRRETRMGMRLATRVQGQSAEGPWVEMSATSDASFGGCSFVLRRALLPGHVLHLDLPLPKAFRRYDLQEGGYSIYALVRSSTVLKDGHRIGVMFLGRNPPRGYLQNPTGRYLLPNDPKPAPKDRRLHRRFALFLNLKLLRTERDGSLQQENTVAENLGKGGAQVLTGMTVTKGDVLMVEELDGGFRTRAEVKNVYIGKDNVPRLNLRFLDAEAPDRLIPAE
jgi:PilZ domain